MACRQTCSNKAVVHERVQRGKPGLWRLFGGYCSAPGAGPWVTGGEGLPAERLCWPPPHGGTRVKPP